MADEKKLDVIVFVREGDAQLADRALQRCLRLCGEQGLTVKGVLVEIGAARSASRPVVEELLWSLSRGVAAGVVTTHPWALWNVKSEVGRLWGKRVTTTLSRTSSCLICTDLRSETIVRMLTAAVSAVTSQSLPVLSAPQPTEVAAELVGVA